MDPPTTLCVPSSPLPTGHPMGAKPGQAWPCHALTTSSQGCSPQPHAPSHPPDCPPRKLSHLLGHGKQAWGVSPPKAPHCKRGNCCSATRHCHHAGCKIQPHPLLRKCQKSHLYEESHDFGKKNSKSYFDQTEGVRQKVMSLTGVATLLSLCLSSLKPAHLQNC